METRTPLQKRGIETKKKIMNAGVSLFSTKGYYNINSKVIAKEADVSIGSFYAYFKDKKELLIELIKDFKDQKFKLVYSELENHQEPDNSCEVDVILEFKSNITKFVNNLIFSTMKYPTEFHIELLQLSYRDEDIKSEYNEYCQEEIAYLKEVFTNFPNNFNNRQIDHLAQLIQKLNDSFIFMILKEEDDIIKKSLISILENSIFNLIEEEILKISKKTC